jgi:deoxyribodipyrimidine photolyase-related protein
MVLSNLMLLCEVAPSEAYRWFTEMQIDSSEWVTIPNVFGLGQYADEGLTGARPYICGSAYIRRLSHFEEGPWCDILDGLYWSFVEKHAAVFSKNPRTSVALAPLHKLDASHKEKIYKAAEKFKNEVTSLPKDQAQSNLA